MELIIVKLSILIIFINFILSGIKLMFNLPSVGSLFCGISGFSLRKSATSNEIRIALNKAKILGLYNMSRGKDSCGISCNGEIIKGTGTVKMFDEFIQNTVFPLPTENKVFLCHNRQASRGVISEKNAHPFVINDDLHFIHNGTITNIPELCKKYDLDPKDYDVDTECLATLIYNKGFEVLEQYIGGAALAFTYLTDLNTLYLYHGASKNYRNGNLIEERPLYTMQTKEGFYFSSIKDALEAIRDDVSQEPVELPHNVVYKITDGKLDTSWKFEVERETKNITYTYEPPACGVTRNCSVGKTYSNSKLTKSNLTSIVGTGTVPQPAILRESLPKKLYETIHVPFVYYHHGRYWEYPRRICNGIMFLKDKGGYVTDGFDHDGADTFYFFMGYMLKDKAAYNELKDKETQSDSFIYDFNGNFALEMSKYSKWPVTAPISYSKDVGPQMKFSWYCNHRVFDNKFTPKFSARNYSIKQGLLSAITTSHREDTMFSDYTLAVAEWKALESGGLLQGPGGDSSKDLPFPVKVQAPTLFNEHNEVPEKDIEFWFETKYESIDEIEHTLGEPELGALDRFYRWHLEGLSPIDVKQSEVDFHVSLWKKAVVDNNTTFIDCLENDEEKKQFKDFYDDEILNGPLLTSSVPMTEKYTEEVNSVLESDIDDDPLEEVVDNKEAIDNEILSEEMCDAMEFLDSLADCADNLQGCDTSDLAQDIANQVYKSIDQLLDKFTSFGESYKNEELIEKVKYLRFKRKHISV